VDFVGEIDEQAVSDDAGKRYEVGRQAGGVVDPSERTVEHEVTVVGDDGAVLAFGRPESRLAAQSFDGGGNGRFGVGQDRDGNGRDESAVDAVTADEEGAGNGSTADADSGPESPPGSDRSAGAGED